MRQLNAPDIADRLTDFSALKDGWLEKGAIAPDPDRLNWLSTTFYHNFPPGAPRPHIFPTANGGIRMEWSLENQQFILEINLATHAGEWLWFDRASDREHEKQLNLNEPQAWQWIAVEIARRTRNAGSTTQY